MIENTADSRRVEVWVSMAEHFLDTETRQDIPHTALRCAEAELSTVDVRRIWLGEVSPAVGFNVLDIAGEWAGWDRDWLLGRIARVRGRNPVRAGVCRWLRGRFDLLGGVRTSIERCAAALQAESSGADRGRLSRDLRFLAQHYFDFCPAAFGTLDAVDAERIRALYPEPFRYIMGPALVRGEARAAEARVAAALAGAER